MTRGQAEARRGRRRSEPAPGDFDRRLRKAMSERRRTAAALRASEETVSALLDATTETALLINADGTIVALNATAFRRIASLAPKPVGKRPEDLRGRNVFDLFPPELAERRRKRNERVVRTGKPARFVDERAGRWMDNTIYPVFDRKGRVVRLAIFSYDITLLKETQLALERALEAERERARRDALTGVLNHGAIVEDLHALVGAGGGMHAVCMIDVDGLKAVNDAYGHPMGDAVLVAVANALAVDGTFVGRYGGDEFVAILPGADRDDAGRYCEQVERRLEETRVTHPGQGVTLAVRASIGVAIHPDDASSIRELIARADQQMYIDKRRRPIVHPRVIAPAA
jgi:diguanylate cyclase (GGDEF)-like protein/PAS domain S-box-containing protein